MQVIVDMAKCVGAGACVLTAPDVFDQNEDDGKVIVMIQSPDEARRNEVVESCNVCPTMALSIQD